VIDAIDHLGTRTQAAISQAEERYRDLILTLDDEARDGPRLFSLQTVDSSLRHPGLTKQTVRLTLWCEHSRLPIHILNAGKPPTGIYDIEVPRDWLIKAAPWIRAISVVVRSLLPISLAEIKLELSDTQWKAVGEQLELADKSLAALAGAGAGIETQDGPGQRVADTPPGETARRAEGALLRTLHTYLKDKDPSFAGLERVRHHDRYLWVHPSFVSLYRPPLPSIPSVAG
jgi:hypothetical protein